MHRSFAVFSCLRAIVIGSVLLYAPVLAQEPPVPSDPLELVTGNAQPVQDVNQRAEIINLLVNAHRYSNVRAQPYDLKTTFTVSGSLSSGTVASRRHLSRGRAISLDRAGSRLFGRKHESESHFLQQPASRRALPLRLIQFREAIFYNEPLVGPSRDASHRQWQLNGVDLMCALVAHNATAPAATGGRQWEEEEYCADPKAGTLVTYSHAPGSYIAYDYSKGLDGFTANSIANAFTITEAGQTIIEAQIESVTDP